MEFVIALGIGCRGDTEEEEWDVIIASLSERTRVANSAAKSPAGTTIFVVFVVVIGDLIR